MRGLPPVRAGTIGGYSARTRARFPVKLRAGGVYKVCGREHLYILGAHYKECSISVV